MLWDPPDSEEELREPLERNLKAWSAGQAFNFTIERREDREFVGRVSIRPTPDPEVWDIGFWTHPRLQRQGFMTEAAQAVVDFGFEKLGAKAIVARHATWNTASRRVLEHIGMREVGHMANGFKKRGAWVPEFLMRIEKCGRKPNLHPQADAAQRPS